MLKGCYHILFAVLILLSSCTNFKLNSSVRQVDGESDIGATITSTGTATTPEVPLTQFSTPNSGFNNNITAMAVEPFKREGKTSKRIFISGTFTHYGSYYSPGLVALYFDGTVDETFRSQLTFINENDVIETLKFSENGNLYIGGDFDATSTANLGQVITDGPLAGQLSPDFTVPLNSWETGLNRVDALFVETLDSSERLYLGGNFHLKGGGQWLAAIDVIGGQAFVDVNFSASLTTNVFALAVGQDGLWAGGLEGLLLVEPKSGETLDHAIREAPGTQVSSLFIQDEDIYVAGDFTEIGFQSNVIRYQYIENVLTPDPSFASHPFIGNIDSMFVNSSGYVLLGGSLVTFKSSGANGFCVLDRNGELILGSDSLRIALDRPFNLGQVASVIWADESLIIGGQFEAYQGHPVGNILKLTSKAIEDDGAHDASFAASGSPSRTLGDKSIVSATLHDSQIDSEGNLYVAGDFDRIRGYERHGIAKYTANGILDSQFHPGFDQPGDVPVRAILHLEKYTFLGGEFVGYSYSGKASPNARYSLVKVDKNGNDIGQSHTGVWDGETQAGVVHALIKAPAVGGNSPSLYVAGKFDRYHLGDSKEPLASTSGLVKITEDFWPLSEDGSGFYGGDATIFALATSEDSTDLWVGGSFDYYEFKGTKYYCKNFIRLSADGEPKSGVNHKPCPENLADGDRAILSVGPNGPVYSILADPQLTILGGNLNGIFDGTGGPMITGGSGIWQFTNKTPSSGNFLNSTLGLFVYDLYFDGANTYAAGQLVDGGKYTPILKLVGTTRLDNVSGVTFKRSTDAKNAVRTVAAFKSSEEDFGIIIGGGFETLQINSSGIETGSLAALKNKSSAYLSMEGVPLVSDWKIGFESVSEVQEAIREMELKYLPIEKAEIAK